MDSDLILLDLIRSLALRSQDWQPAAQETLDTIQLLLSNIVSNPDDKTRRRIRLGNAKIARAIVQAPGAVEFLQRHCGFKREHLVADATPDMPAMNEMVLTCAAEDLEPLRSFALGIGETNLDHVFFTEAVKVALPNGTELKGAFAAAETVAEVKSWIARCRDDHQRGLWPELAAAWDPSRVFRDDETVQEAHLHKNKLLVKLTGDHGDKARALMEQVEAKRRADVALERERQVAKARLTTANKFSKRAEQTESRERNVSRFREDRVEAEERAKRVVAQVAKTSAASTVTTTDLARPVDSAAVQKKLA